MPFFQVNPSINLYYIDEGPATAPAVLLIPGIACDLHDWNWQVPLLLSLGFRVVTPDPRGQGLSSAPLPTPDITSWPGPSADPSIIDYYPETIAEDFVALLKHLSIPNVIVFAHSRGCPSAAHLAVAHPKLVRALVILDPVYTMPNEVCDRLFADPPMVMFNLLTTYGADLSPPNVPKWHSTWVARRGALFKMELVNAMNYSHWTDKKGLGRREVVAGLFRERVAKGETPIPRLTLGCSEFWIGAETEEGEGRMPKETEFDEARVVGGVGHWFHQHKSEEVNAILEEWLKKAGLLPVKEEAKVGETQ